MGNEKKQGKGSVERSIKTHKDLEVWKKAMSLVENVYRVTTDYPISEMYGLTLQTRKSAVSVPSNIAEGAARFSNKEFIHFLYVALGSIAELETQLMVACRLESLKNKEVFENVIETRRVLLGLIRYVKEKKLNSC